MQKFLVRHIWKADRTVVSHTVIEASDAAEAQRIADQDQAEHDNDVIEKFDDRRD